MPSALNILWRLQQFPYICRMTNRQLKTQVQTEIDTAYLYQLLADKEDDARLKDIFHKMSLIELGHAKKILEKLHEQGFKDLELPKPSYRAKIKERLAKYLGYGFILNELINLETKISRSIVQVKREDGETITGDEFNHVKILENLAENQGVDGSVVTKFEGRHKSVGGNALRAAVLGANDGLVSNLSLIMGVAGAITQQATIVITGLAGLLAGAISMAMGEWLSVKNSTELFERQIALELEELENNPEEELLELTLIYQAKGMDKEQAEKMAKKVFENKDTALSTLVQEELGIDINDTKDSAWEAAITSFILFAIGAVIPLIPFLVFSGSKMVVISLVFSTIGLFLIGAATSLFTGKNIWFSGFRQVLFGLVAAAVTYGLGTLVGGNLG